MAIRTDTAVDPFGASIDGVTALVPEARLKDALAAGQYGVTTAQVRAWLDELSGAVAMRLDGWHRLSNTPDDDEQTSDRDQLKMHARTVVHNGVASYLEAARHPERAQVNDTAYDRVLWDRYTTGLDGLAAWLTGRLTDPDEGDQPAPDLGGIAGSFPLPLIGDALRF